MQLALPKGATPTYMVFQYEILRQDWEGCETYNDIWADLTPRP